MTFFNESYVVDKTGERIAVLLPIDEYLKILDALEELESIRAYDLAKKSTEDVIPFHQAIEEIEQGRR